MNDEPPFDEEELDLFSAYDPIRYRERVDELVAKAFPDGDELRMRKERGEWPRPRVPGGLDVREWALLEPGAEHYDEPVTLFWGYAYGDLPFDVPPRKPETLLEPFRWLGEIRRDDIRRISTET